MSSGSGPIIYCKFCDDPKPQIRMVTLDGKGIATNLDGTPHKTHIKNQLMQTWNKVSPDSVSFKNNEELAKYTYAARQEAIDKAHDEKMKAYKALTDAINNLAEKLDKRSLSRTVDDV